MLISEWIKDNAANSAWLMDNGYGCLLLLIGFFVGGVGDSYVAR